MSKNDSLVSKENWQSVVMNPGPSNTTLVGLPAGQNFRQVANGRIMKQSWICSVCRKELSSKRSHTEHMNIHNKSRPFQCEHCVYAAASQMTLHRHKLRNHTPKAEWRYRCPYCEDAYMEPAGYQQHVQQRHAGRSATYGCPFRICKFTSKCQRHFRDHLVKHDRSDKIEGGVDPCALTNQQLVRYMVNDEIGYGYQRSDTTIHPANLEAPIPAIRVRPQATIAPKIYVAPTGRSAGRSANREVVWHLEKVIPKKTIIRSNQIPPRSPVQTSSVQLPRARFLVSHPSSSVECTISSAKFGEPIPPSYEKVEPDESVYDAAAQEEDYDDEVEEEQEEEYDEEPPVLESFGNVLDHQQMLQQHQNLIENNWIESESEMANNDVVFPNGFIDDELD